mgnify:CR=1 FL=1|tara:strand:+ start:6275 stop:6760 length:486 start_codon:yes stop_codon:yes gene_type:complete
MELTQQGRTVAGTLGGQQNLGAIDQAKLQALAAAQTGRFTTADELAEAVATEEIDAEMYGSLIDTYIAEGLLTTGGGMVAAPSPEGHASNCSVCGHGMINQGSVGDTDMCISCYSDLSHGEISLKDGEFDTGGIEAQEGEFSFDMGDAFSGIELKQGEISI